MAVYGLFTQAPVALGSQQLAAQCGLREHQETQKPGDTQKKPDE